MNKTSLHIDQSIVDSSNFYALRSMILVFQSRKIEDLNENGRISYWENPLKPKRQNQLYPKASEILQIIEDHHKLMQIVMGEGDIESKITSFEDLGDFQKNTHCNEHNSRDDMNISELIPENIVFINGKSKFPKDYIIKEHRIHK